MKHKFPQCAPANLETNCLLEIGDLSRKLRLLCSCQFLLCALALTFGSFETKVTYCLYSRDTGFLWIVNLGSLIFWLLSNDSKLVYIVHIAPDCWIIAEDEFERIQKKWGRQFNTITRRFFEKLRKSTINLTVRFNRPSPDLTCYF
jgi:hypothetical protein